MLFLDFSKKQIVHSCNFVSKYLFPSIHGMQYCMFLELLMKFTRYFVVTLCNTHYNLSKLQMINVIYYTFHVRFFLEYIYWESGIDFENKGMFAIVVTNNDQEMSK